MISDTYEPPLSLDPLEDLFKESPAIPPKAGRPTEAGRPEDAQPSEDAAIQKELFEELLPFSIEDPSLPPGIISLSEKELFELSAFNWKFYCEAFFSRTCKNAFAPMHEDMWSLLEDPSQRLVSFMCFRGSAKTTIIRLFISRRVSLGTSRTIMVVGASLEHARKTVGWLRDQIDTNKKWSRLFGLSRGRHWTDEWLEIRHALLDISINVVAFGILGNIRGLNINDFRPDLIVVDDPNDEENTATPQQRKKTKDLFFGSLLNSLAPESEAPEGKIVLAQTPFNVEDLPHICEVDANWASRRYGCFTAEHESAWTDRWTTEQLLSAKSSFISRGDLSLWLREMEVQIVSDESKPFQVGWLQYWNPAEPPLGLVYFMGIDPVPPPSEREKMEGLRNKDFECLSIVGYDPSTTALYLMEYSFNKGHDPSWTITETFRLWDKWQGQGLGLQSIRVEAIAYQRTLSWLLGQAMRAKGRYLPINAVADVRKKEHRLLQAIRGPASGKQLWVSPHHVEFIAQYTQYPAVPHDDILDSVSIAIDEALTQGPAYEGMLISTAQAELLPPVDWRRAP